MKHLLLISLITVWGLSSSPPAQPGPFTLNHAAATMVAKSDRQLPARLVMMSDFRTTETGRFSQLDQLVPFGPDLNRLRRRYYDGGRWSRGGAMQYDLIRRRLIFNLGPIRIVPYTIRQQP